jgi:hypothetical protein
MTFSDTSLERTGVDPAVSAMVNGVPIDNSRPLTDEERQAADREAPVGERVYAPASERVPVEPVAGHRAFVEHTDMQTPERQAAEMPFEPSFTRVSRPSSIAMDNTPASLGGHSGATNSGDHGADAMPRSGGPPPRMAFGFGVSWVTVAFCSIGAWLFFRWRRERNRPINRLRRQARQAAEVVRRRVPASREEAVQPTVGLAAALLSAAIVVWQQAQSRSQTADKVVTRQAAKKARRAVDAASEVQWHKRLANLKERWTPTRQELEKITISRHQ